MKSNTRRTERPNQGFSAKRFSRRQLGRSIAGLGRLAAFGSILSGCVSSQPSAPFATKPNAPEPPAETTRLRLLQTSAICPVHQLLAKDLFQSEGFTDVSWRQFQPATIGNVTLANGDVDLSMYTSGILAAWLDAGDAITILAGVHPDCYELSTTDRVRTVGDLRGKTISVPVQDGRHQLFLFNILAHIGINPHRDVSWFVAPPAKAMESLGAGIVDAYIGFPPEPQELRARRTGHVVLNTAIDKPWSQIYCCMIAANRECAQKRPVATKRALRAILKMVDYCAAEPERAAVAEVANGITPSYDFALEVMRGVPYHQWREYDPEDTIRFQVLKLREAGVVKNNSERITPKRWLPGAQIGV